ncbi:AraC family transcriptional regulator [Povalibacter sp.]|uniref:AraC family transcriptional regulator n=1 Tax=Povalibacter sp. TaxID=1962978 RepID=UPI002F41BD3C
MGAGHDLPSAVDDESSAEFPALHSGSSAQSPTDTLSEVLREVRLAGSVFFLVDALTPWIAAAPSARMLLPAIFPRAQHLISYHVVRHGQCWCQMPQHEAMLLSAGDVLVVPHGDPYSLSSEPDMRSEWSLETTLRWFRDMAQGRGPFVVSEGGAGPQRLEIVCGFLGCDVFPFNPVLASLPRLLRVRLSGAGSGERLDRLVEYAVAEARERSAGSRCVLLRISELMCVELVRQHLLSLPSLDTGWLAALRDPVVGRALALLHQRPNERWTLEALAHESITSRSVLAERFTHFLHEPPMQYLARWRMHLAAQMLRDSQSRIARVAFEVGYQSEATFSRAFKKLLGVSPAIWRTQADASIASHIQSSSSR